MPVSLAPDPAASLTLENLLVQFRQRGAAPVRALYLPFFHAEPGSLWGCRGASGSGKTTLLHAIAGLSSLSAGEVRWGPVVVSALPETARDRWRHATVGIVFQEFHLIPELSALENVLLPTHFYRRPPALNPPDRKDRAMELLHRVGILTPRRRAAVLSRGEQQRVALARALMARPRLILADEPTASLDADTGRTIADLLIETAREAKATLVAVSHDPGLLARMDHILTLDAGRQAGTSA